MRGSIAEGNRRAPITVSASRVPGRYLAGTDRGFTLVEMTASVVAILVVMTAAWLLLTTSSRNLSTIDYGGQTSEANRAALASFERDLNHSFLPGDDVSPLLRAEHRRVTILADEKAGDGSVQLITWYADDQKNELIRVVTSVEETRFPTAIGDFDGGVTTTRTVLTGLATDGELGDPQMFTYGVDAVTGFDPENDLVAVMRRVGLVTFHLRNGLPNRTSNVADRTASYRIISLVINGY